MVDSVLLSTPGSPITLVKILTAPSPHSIFFKHHRHYTSHSSSVTDEDEKSRHSVENVLTYAANPDASTGWILVSIRASVEYGSGFDGTCRKDRLRTGQVRFTGQWRAAPPRALVWWTAAPAPPIAPRTHAVAARTFGLAPMAGTTRTVHDTTLLHDFGGRNTAPLRRLGRGN